MPAGTDIPPVLRADQPPPKRHGCFFTGCMISLVLLVLIGGSLFIGLGFLVNRVNKFIMEYTETSPMVLPHVEMSAGELRALKARVDVFGQALEAHTNTAPLVLTDREINALFADSQAVKDLNLQNRFYVSLEGEQIKGQISLPLEEYTRLPFIKTKGRYLNGSGTFKAVLTNDTLSVVIQSLEVKGRPVPEKPLSQLQSQNLADQLNQNEPTARS